jgi:hypothetical protein
LTTGAMRRSKVSPSPSSTSAGATQSSKFAVSVEKVAAGTAD